MLCSRGLKHLFPASWDDQKCLQMLPTVNVAGAGGGGQNCSPLRLTAKSHRQPGLLALGVPSPWFARSPPPHHHHTGAICTLLGIDFLHLLASGVVSAQHCHARTPSTVQILPFFQGASPGPPPLGSPHEDPSPQGAPYQKLRRLLTGVSASNSSYSLEAAIQPQRWTEHRKQTRPSQG